MTAAPSAETRFVTHFAEALAHGQMLKATLGKSAPGAEPTLQNLYLRPVTLKAGPSVQFVFRHTTRDLTQNFSHADAIAQLTQLLGSTFLDAHLFTTTQNLQLISTPGKPSRLKTTAVATTSSAPSPGAPSPSPAQAHNRAKNHLIAPDAPWLRTLSVTNDHAQPREGMAAKFRQINKFVELLDHLVTEAALPDGRAFHLVDMGSGKGYLTFASAAHFGPRAQVTGIEARPELVEFCNTAARTHALTNLHFSAGTIATHIDTPIDVLIALHACDTATDDALHQGLRAQAPLLVVSPCCHKEIRPQLQPPALFVETLRHGIFLERHAELVTDSLRAQLLEYAGYRTKVFEFISTEHTAKNLMIAAIKTRPAGDPVALEKLTAFARHHGIRHQRLADHLGVSLA